MNEPQDPTPNPYNPTRFTPTNGPIPPWSGNQVPPSWPPMPPGPPPHGDRRLIWVLLGLVCVLTVTAVVLTVTLISRHRDEIAQRPTTTSTRAPTPAPVPSDHQASVPVSALDGLLPDRSFVSSAVAAPGIDLTADGTSIDTEDLVDADCQGVVSVSSRVYLGSGWTATRWQHWNNPPETSSPKLTNHVSLSVTTYPQSDTARAFYSNQTAVWRKCAGHIVNGQFASAKAFTDQIWIIGEVTASDRLLATTAVNFDGSGWSCRTMLTVRNNVAVRVGVCGYTDSAPAAQTILDSITQKIDAAA